MANFEIGDRVIVVTQKRTAIIAYKHDSKLYMVEWMEPGVGWTRNVNSGTQKMLDGYIPKALNSFWNVYAKEIIHMNERNKEIYEAISQCKETLTEIEKDDDN